MLKERIIVLLLIMLFISDDTLLFGTNINQTFVALRFAIYGVAIFLLGVILDQKNTDRTYRLWDLIIAGLITVSFILTMSYNGDFRNGYLLQFLTITCAILIAKYVQLEEFTKIFCRILYYLSIISICVFIAALLFRPIINLFPTTVNIGGVEFTNLGLAMVFKDPSIMRNPSIFREPGVYMLYLMIGIIIQLFYNTKIRSSYLIVFIIALLTTLSTSGILIFMVLIIGYLFKSTNFKIKVSIGAFILIGSACFYLIPGLYDEVFSKLGEDSAGYASTLARLSSVSVPFLIFINNFVFGAGLSRFVELYFVYSQELFGIAISPDSSSTNTIINTFAIYGFIWGSLLLFGLIRFAKIMAGSGWMTAAVALALVLMLSSQELRFSLFFNTIIMFGLFHKPVARQTTI